MKTKVCKSRNEAIAEARRRVERYGEEREWLVSPSPPDAYKSAQYHVETFVLQGSPPRGYVITGDGFAVSLDSQGDVVAKCCWY
jgi:hypothetical protein